MVVNSHFPTRKKRKERIKNRKETEKDTKKEEGAALTSRDRWADLPPWMFERDFIKRARYTGIKLGAEELHIMRRVT